MDPLESTGFGSGEKQLFHGLKVGAGGLGGGLVIFGFHLFVGAESSPRSPRGLCGEQGFGSSLKSPLLTPSCPGTVVVVWG